EVMVADGLGHGPVAAEASTTAITLFDRMPGRAPAEVLEEAHQAMRSTRGAAVATVTLDAATGSLVFCGAGNIAGRLISGHGDHSLMSQHGTLGLQIRRLQEVRHDWPPHAIVVLHSDGLQTRWQLTEAPGL